jgi:hypothetical protein
MVFDNLLAEHDLPDIGNGIMVGTGGGFVFPDIYRINQLSFSGISFEEVSAESIDKLPIPCSDGIYGILGKEVMQHLVWQIDFKQQQILVANDKNAFPIAPNALSIPLTENQYGHQLYTKVQLGQDSIKKTFTIDLGSNGYACVGIKCLAKQDDRKIEIEGSSSTGLDGDYESTAFLQAIDSFQVGDLVIPQITVYASKTPMNLLGLGFFENFRTTISWKDKTLILEPYEATNFKRKGYGYGARFNEEKKALFVKAIYKGQQADQSGIRIGDKILSINGQSMDEADKYCDFDYKNMDELTLEIDREGRVEQVCLKKQEYFASEEVGKGISMK